MSYSPNRLAYFCRGSGTASDTAKFYQSDNNGVTFSTGPTFSTGFAPPYGGSSGAIAEPAGTLLVVDARRGRDLTFQLTPTSTLGAIERSWQVRRISPNGSITVLDDFLPAGYDYAEAWAVTRAGNTIYAAGAATDIVVTPPNYTMPTTMFLRRSTDGGATWSTVQTRPVGELDGWNSPELIPMPDGSVLYYFSYTVATQPRQFLQIARPSGMVEDRTALVANEYLRSGIAVSANGQKVALVTNKLNPAGALDVRNRAIHLINLSDLTQVVHDFAYKNHTTTSFESLRFAPVGGDLVLVGWGATNAQPQENFAVAVNCR